MNLMDLFIKIEAQDNATAKVKMATEAVKKGASKIGKFIAGATAAITSAGIALGGIGLKYNSQMENYTTNFKVMLGSAEDAAKKVEELKTMAAKTPFGMSDLADATQTLLAFQVPAENTNDILKMLGDVALGDKNKLSGLALVFGQVSSAGKLQGQDLLQMINQGFNPLNYIAQRTGESMEELRDRMSKGAISAEEVTQAFKDATSEGGQFFNGMDEASKTLSGQLSTLKDNVISRIGEAFQPLSDKLTNEIIPKVIEFVDSINVSEVKEKFDSFVATFEKFSPIIVGLITPALTFFGILKGMAIAKSVAAGFQILNTVLAANPIVLVISVIAGLVAAIITLWNTNDEFKNAVITAWTAVKNFFVETIPAAFNSIVEWVKQVPEKIAQFGAKMLAAAIVLYTNLKDGIRNGFIELLTLVTEWVDENIITPVKDKATAAYDAAKAVIEKMKQGIKDAWESVKSWFSDAWDSLFNRSGSVSVNVSGGTTRAGGLDYVPANGFPTILHKGEAVLTRSEADAWRKGTGSGGGITIIQNIQAIARTPVEFASATEAYFEQARWAL